MKKIFKYLFNRWMLTFLGLAAVSALIWLAGPLIAFADYRPLETDTIRIVLIFLIIGCYLGKLIWKFIRAKNLNARFMEGLLRQTAIQPPDANDSAGAEEVALLHKRFEEAVTVLKKAHPGSNKPRSWLTLFNRQYVYELPWYIFIGAPGSGKTTALVNSGLQFPLAERFGQEVIRGIGGTRNCDWWFTDEAILLDTAGRYTTQESHQEADHAAWTGFLQLLKKYRPRRPINGAIVTISVADLLQQTPAQREAQANALRKRIQELHTELNIRFPIYVLVTKSDLLAGFIEFFGRYGKEERTQVWGVSFSFAEEPDTFPLANFNTEFSALEQRLNERLIDYLQQERDIRKRALLYAFPQQFSNLKEILGKFLNQIFSPSRFEQQPLLRGIYLTSGTQEGNPIDRMMGNLARAFQLDHKLLLPHRPSGKSFFLTRLIKDVIFSEAELAGTNLRWERRYASLQWGIFSAAILLTLGITAAWVVSYLYNQAYIAKVEANTSIVSNQVEKLPVMNTDIISLLPTLRFVQALPDTPGIDSHSPPLSMGLGLYQGDKLAAASNRTYQRLLQDIFLPQLILRIEQLLSNTEPGNLELLYEGLKAYIMLHQAEHFDPVALKAFIMADWEINLPRNVTNEQRKALESHLDTLLSHGQLSSPVPVNTQLITKVRNIVASTPIAQRIYHRLKQQGVGADLPEFTIAKYAGPAASLVFTRASNLPLTRGVPGLFSYDGYYQSFSQATEEITGQLVREETWVLDLPEKERSRFLDSHAAAEINDKVRRLYLHDYAQAWDTFISDIRLIHTNTLQESIQLARLLSATDSPLPPLLQAIVKEVTLVNSNETDRDIVEKATDKVKNASKRLKQLLGQIDIQTTASIVSGPENIVDDRFKALRQMVQPTIPGQPAPIDAILTRINELYILLTATEEALQAGVAPPASGIYTEIDANARRLPEPLRSMFTTLVTDSVNQAQGITRENLNQSLKAIIVELCLKSTSGRYPFIRESTQDVTQDDFAQLFASGGRFDDFFQKELAQHVNTSTQPWHFRKAGDAVHGIASKDLHEFYRAKIIRDVFFNSGGRTASINLTFKPIDMDSSITQFILDVDGQLVKYGHGPQIPVAIQWPGPRGSSQVRLQIFPPSREGRSGLVFEGPWALFRMFDQVQINPSAQPEKFTAIFDLGGRKAQFEITTNSVQNPFRLEALRQFKCPARL